MNTHRSPHFRWAGFWFLLALLVGAASYLCWPSGETKPARPMSHPYPSAHAAPGKAKGKAEDRLAALGLELGGLPLDVQREQGGAQ